MNESPWEQAVRLTQAAMRATQIKRFYATAAAGEVDGGYALLLDGRGARTPAKNKLVAPTRAIAEAIAAEWAGQGAVVDPSSSEITSDTLGTDSRTSSKTGRRRCCVTSTTDSEWVRK